MLVEDAKQANDVLLELGVNQETINCVTDINGYNLKILENILFWKTGLRNFAQLEDFLGD